MLEMTVPMSRSLDYARDDNDRTMLGMIVPMSSSLDYACGYVRDDIARDDGFKSLPVPKDGGQCHPKKAATSEDR